jgi:hypothetical protein
LNKKKKDMKKITTILGVAAVAGVAYKVLTHKKADGSTLLDSLTEAGKGWADKFNEFADASGGWKDKFNEFVDDVKDRVMPDMKGPNGEDVFTDMYKRNYYTDGQGSRIYMEEA